MREIKQEDVFGCGVACTAAVLGKSYQEAISLFQGGRKKAAETGFYCREIVRALAKAGLNYEFKHIGETQRERRCKSRVIVFIKKSNKYPVGHYLCRIGNKWMDPWINFPNEDIKAGYRRRLPEKPIYLIYPV